MKKVVVFLWLIAVIKISIGQDYETIVDSTKMWSVVTYCYSEQPYELISASTLSYRFKGDTLVNNLHYSFLEICMDSVYKNWARTAYMFRDDSAGKIYIHNNEREIQLYDYNVEQGDTIWIPDINTFTISDVYAIIDDVSLINFAGKERTAINVGHMTYIKGFGTYSGILGIFYFDYTGNCSDGVSCFYQNDTLIYQDGENCFINFEVSIPEVKKEKILIYPNPTSNFINIDLGEFSNAEFTLFSIEGRILIKEKVNSSYKIIDLIDVSSGIYLFDIKKDRQILKYGFLIIN